MSSRNPYYEGPPSDHFDGARFFNPSASDEERGLLHLLRWRLAGGGTPWPAAAPQRHALDKPPERVGEGGLRVSAIGHASFLLQLDGLNILLDPVWSERASPFTFAGPKRLLPPGAAFDSLPSIDAVLVSHNHYDHLDVATLARLWRRDRPRIITPLGNDAIIRAAIPDVTVETGDWGDAVALSSALRVHLVPTHHWSARGVRDRRCALWCSFVIEAPGGSVYAIGDTGFADGQIFRAVGRRFPDLRLALLPIGAYEPRWFMKPFHMNPAEAVEAFRLCGALQAIGHHWGTFRLTDEGWHDPPEALTAALAAAGVPAERFRTMLPGEWAEV